MRVIAWLLLMTLGHLAMASDSTSLVEQVYELNSNGTVCLSCPDGVVPGAVREVVEAADLASYGGWLQLHFTKVHDDFNFHFKRCRPDEVGYHFQMGESHGVCFDSDGFQVMYEEVPCWFWDCSTPRMWWVGESGRQRWRRKVPFASAPVQPFVVGPYVLYVGRSTGGNALVIVDALSGRVLESFVFERDERGISQSALMLAPSFYRDGYVHLKRVAVTKLDPETREPVSRNPARTYVLKVRF